MKLLAASLLAALAGTARACEGACIVGVTDVWLSNYTAVVQGVFDQTSKAIAERLVPNHAGDASSYLRPLAEQYNNASYNGMEKAIFPSYFHGKCQQDGVEPEGCPNPDCPVVCGTPGSLVHFYSTLRFIAFNQTRALLQDLMSPGSAGYQQLEDAVVRDATAAGSARRTMPVAAPRNSTMRGTKKGKKAAKATAVPMESTEESPVRRMMSKMVSWRSRRREDLGAGAAAGTTVAEWSNDDEQVARPQENSVTPGGEHDFESHEAHEGLDELNVKMHELEHPEPRAAHDKDAHKKHKSGHESYSSTSTASYGASTTATTTALYSTPTTYAADSYAPMPAYAASPYGARRAIVARDSARRAGASADDVRTALQEIMKGVPERLASICGGTPEDAPNGLPSCSWEQAMKPYILTWP
ncbi:hypothetical protein PENSPDRAFT_661410 [Peniophora sp. CONT]|nr:hypothetical protein PENSPDRAFT_661410 [Peniophora sp. CONT]